MVADRLFPDQKFIVPITLSRVMLEVVVKSKYINIFDKKIPGLLFFPLKTSLLLEYV